MVVLVAAVLLTSSAVALGQPGWTEVQPAGDDGYCWTTVAVSENGGIILAGEADGHLYLSTDGGDNWQKANVPVTGEGIAWVTTAMSADGQTMLAGQRKGRLYLSTDGGTTWSEADTTDKGKDLDWEATISADGEAMMAFALTLWPGGTGRLHLSTNGGSNWSEATGLAGGDHAWRIIAVSDGCEVMLAGDVYGLYSSTDKGGEWVEGVLPAGGSLCSWWCADVSGEGETLVVAATDGLYLSADKGRTWSEAGSKFGVVEGMWWSTAVSDDGQTILAGEADGDLYLSTDGGVNWQKANVPTTGGDIKWAATAMSADGQTMLIAGLEADTAVGGIYLAPASGEGLIGHLYLSTDGGAGWTEAAPPAGGEARYWGEGTVTVSADGSTMVAGVCRGRLYLSTSSTPSQPTSYTLTYNAGPGGTISGPSPQTVERGKDGTAVTAVPDTGYHFTGWSDGVTTATRTDTNVQSNKTVTANFASDEGGPTPDPSGPGHRDRWNDIPDARWLTDYGITVGEAASVADGYKDGSFRPDGPLTRGQCAKMIVTGFALPTLDPAVPTFPDTLRDHYFYPWVEGGAAAGCIWGYTDGLFRSERNITREQFASMLGRILIQKELDKKGFIQGEEGTYLTGDAWYEAEGAALLARYADHDKMAIDHVVNSAYLIQKGILKGSVKDGVPNLTPKGWVTRAQATAMIVRAGKVIKGF